MARHTGLAWLLVFSAWAYAPASDYAIYVWTQGFDATVPGCDEAKLIAWDKAMDPECYTHNWEPEVNRQWLWDTANRPGRELGRLFLSDVKSRLEGAYLAGDCSDPDVAVIQQMLFDGHCKAPDADLHALFATSDVDVSEKDHIKYVVWYNDNCAADVYERFDGIAVNNEAWNDVKCTTPAAEQAYLDDLQTIVDEAALQVSGTLDTHYSIGWRWSYCDGVEVTVDWDGTVQPATYHMIDIFDTVDVQVATVDPAAVGSRAITAGYDHAVTEGKPIYVLSYTNKSSPCTTTHFPFTCSPSTDPARTDEFLMESVIDGFPANGIPEAIGGIHYFRGVYSTGGHSDWPTYYSGSVTPCAIVTFTGTLTFASTNEIDWTAQANATLYEIVQAEDPTFDTGCKREKTPDTHATVDDVPPPGGMLTYLVRVRAPDLSEWGRTSSGEPRSGECL